MDNQEREKSNPMGQGMRPGGLGRNMHAFAGGRAKDVKTTVRRLLSYFQELRGPIMMVLISVVAATALTAVMPMALGEATNILRETMGTDLPETFVIMVAAYGGMVLLSTAFQLLQGLYMANISQKTVYKLRRALFHQLQTLSLRFFDKKERGDTMSRLVNDVETISNMLSHNATSFITGIVTIIVTTFVMFFYNWRLALVALVPLPLIGMLTRWISKMTRKHYAEQQKHMGSVNGFVEEAISALPVTKVYCREQNEIEKFNRRNQAYKKTTIKAQVLTGIMMPTINMINNIGFALLAAIGGIFIVNQTASVGAVLAFFFYAKNYGRPIAQLAQTFAQIQSAIAGAERIFEIMDERAEIYNQPNAADLGQISGEVIFKEVDFSYHPDQPVLKNINLHASPGQMIALVGPTGAGKTTIINLLTRFYDIDSGEIFIDGHEIRQVTKESLRRHLGIVLQDTYLFRGSVKQNILYGRLDATDEEVIRAARLAHADQFIHRLPEGYDTMLSNEGSNLSEGQRQLIAIARAILADPSILILDEATSSVDTRTEIHLQEAMLELMKGRTAFVIAHRLSTIQKADCIVVIRDGTIIEQGTHQELIGKKGFYYELYKSQFSESIA